MSPNHLIIDAFPQTCHIAMDVKLQTSLSGSMNSVSIYAVQDCSGRC